MMKKTVLSTAIVAAMGGISMSAQAALTNSSTLSFNPGTPFTTGCTAGGFTNGTCQYGTAVDITDMAGSFFTMDTNGDGITQNSEKNAISMYAPIHIGTTARSTGQHTGIPNGSESPAIDNPWNFNGNAGMHTLTSPISVISNFGSTKTLDFSGWGVNWGAYGTSPAGTAGSTIPMGGIATIVCSQSTCSTSSSYVLDMAVHVPAAFTSVPYTLHLEGSINHTAVPVPAAAWLFGSGLAGLAGVARRRRSKKG